MSTAGGVDNAPINAHKIGATAFALFTKNQRQWHAPPLSAKTITAFKKNCRIYGYTARQILPHDSYLINLGHPERTALEKSRTAFVDELKRCAQLGLTTLNFHPGSHLEKNKKKEKKSCGKCLATISESLNKTLAIVDHVVAVIENTAGQGTNVGYSFEQIAAIIDGVEDKTRVGVCLDICHAFSAGYDLKSEAGYIKTWKAFDKVIGLTYLRGIHLNDSKKEGASRVDRHESLGDGTLGIEVFKRIMNSPWLDHIPLILETPDPKKWAEEITLLKQFLENGMALQL